MARARNIKPGFFRNADLVELSMEARLLFVGLWTLADREGRLDDRPKQIKMEIFPADSVDCDALLDGLAATNMVARYEVDGKRYLQVVNFAKHQNPHRDEKPSTIPDACGNITSKTPTPAKHGASTVQAPCKDDAEIMPPAVEPITGTVPIRLNPDPRSLIPDSLIPDSLIPDTPTKGEQLPDQPPDVPDGPARPSMAAAICVAMKAAGMASVNPQHPELLVLVGKGADVGLFAAVAGECAAKGKSFAYALAVVKGRMADAALLADTALAVPQVAGAGGAGGSETVYQRSMRERYEEATGTGRARPFTPIADITDYPANFLEIAS
jgi:hypothetical protein